MAAHGFRKIDPNSNTPMNTYTSTPAALIQMLAHGLMADFTRTTFPSKVYGFKQQTLTLPCEPGTAYGYVMEGEVTISDGYGRTRLVEAGHYFCIPHQQLEVSGDGTGFLVSRLGFVGLAQIGGPAERVGRLRYIDGCSDTLLVGPPVKGDPCFNLLHFPGSIDQTMHTHPSIRAGLIHSGSGWCRTATGRHPLYRGAMFILFPDAVHAFATDPDQSMTLTVFHPDTDTGPSHDDHPMLNRTIVEGVSAAKIDGIRTTEIVE